MSCLKVSNLVGHDRIDFTAAEMLHQRAGENDAVVAACGSAGELDAVVRNYVDVCEQYACLLSQVEDSRAQLAADHFVKRRCQPPAYDATEEEPADIAD